MGLAENLDALLVKFDIMMGHSAKNILGKHYDKPDHELFIETLDSALFGN